MQKPCPDCGSIAFCDVVDIGIGVQQCGPYYCEECGWVEDDLYMLLREIEEYEGEPF